MKAKGGNRAPAVPFLWRGEATPEKTKRKKKKYPPVPLDAAGLILSSLYAHGIPFRIETNHDVGFTWVWVKHEPTRMPRLLMDELLNGGRVLEQSHEAARSTDAGQFLVSDWYHRGVETTLEGAASALASTVASEIPISEFADWWVNFLST